MFSWIGSRGRRASSGFSLVEIMAALAILSVALVLVIQLFSSSLRTTRHSADKSAAMLHARSLLEEACALPDPESAGGILELDGGMRAEVLVEEDSGMYEITVSVEGPGGGYTLSCARAYHENK